MTVLAFKPATSQRMILRNEEMLRDRFARLDELNREKARLEAEIAAGSRVFAKARGMPFMRIEAVRRELGL